jgi:hypothetical protein
MLVYPQLATGALGQFPIVRQRRVRTVMNSAADGSCMKFGDPAGASTEWQLSYCGLSGSELESLQRFFLACEGSLNSFTFVDPAANLLAWSEVLDDSVWIADPFLSRHDGLADPKGGANAWQLTNSGSGPQSLSQIINAPAGYSYCFSVYVQAPQPTSISLAAGSAQEVRAVGPPWSRISVTGVGPSGDNSLAFAISIPAGSTVNVFGPQAEAQTVPSVYQTSTGGGVYENARFRDDFLSFTTQAPNRNSVTVNIHYANHL